MADPDRPYSVREVAHAFHVQKAVRRRWVPPVPEDDREPEPSLLLLLLLLVMIPAVEVWTFGRGMIAAMRSRLRAWSGRSRPR